MPVKDLAYQNWKGSSQKCLVKINSKKLMFYNYSFIKKFKHKIIITGYKNKNFKVGNEKIKNRIYLQQKLSQH